MDVWMDGWIDRIRVPIGMLSNYGPIFIIYETKPDIGRKSRLN